MTDKKQRDIIKELERKEKELLSNEKIINKLMKEVDELKQECEELKEQLQANQPTGICETCTAITIFQNDKYRKALKTIEEICWNDVHTFADGTQLRYDSLDDILDIINRLKGEL